MIFCRAPSIRSCCRCNSFLLYEWTDPSCLHCWKLPYSRAPSPVQSRTCLSKALFLRRFCLALLEPLDRRGVQCPLQHCQGDYGKFLRRFRSFFCLVVLLFSIVPVYRLRAESGTFWSLGSGIMRGLFDVLPRLVDNFKVKL